MGSATDRRHRNISRGWPQFHQEASRLSYPIPVKSPSCGSWPSDPLPDAATRDRSIGLGVDISVSRCGSGQAHRHPIFAECLNGIWPHGHNTGEEVAAYGSDGISQWLDPVRPVDRVSIRLDPDDLGLFAKDTTIRES